MDEIWPLSTEYSVLKSWKVNSETFDGMLKAVVYREDELYLKYFTLP